MGFRLTLKCGLSVQPPFATKSSWPSSYSCTKGSEAFYDSARMYSHAVIHEERVSALGDPLRAQTCLSTPRVIDNDFLETEGIEIEINRGPGASSCNMVHHDTGSRKEADNLKNLTSFQDAKALYFSLLMKNLDILEETIANSEVVRLERDILVQLERLGAIKLFQTCLDRTVKPSTPFNLFDAPSDLVKELPMDDLVDKVFVRSVKKEERKSRRKRSLDKEGCKELERCSKTISKDTQQAMFSSGRRQSNSRIKRRKIARSEAELSRGVKLVTELERVRTVMEEETGQVISMSSWAEAAGIDKIALLQHMHFGWYCRDELLKSTQSLILYIAKNYRGMGVAFEDLVQAGKLGVLQGAQRFDHTRGYKFSTYVQYWIRKSMSNLVAQHARGIRIPSSLSKAINQIRRARKSLSNSQGKYPDGNQIAKFTGLSTAKILSASRCLKVVGSIDQKVGDCCSAKFLELTPDMSIRSPEETVVRQHIVEDVSSLLKGLEPRERQVLILRFGLRSHPRKSLEEIGRLFSVSKEWVRKIERKALTKLLKEDTFQNLSHHMYMQ